MLKNIEDLGAKIPNIFKQTKKPKKKAKPFSFKSKPFFKQLRG